MKFIIIVSLIFLNSFAKEIIVDGVSHKLICVNNIYHIFTNISGEFELTPIFKIIDGQKIYIKCEE